MTVSILGRTVTRSLTIPARSRIANELGEWGLTGDFGVEVACGSVCAASLVMWDQSMQRPNTSVPLIGCGAR